MENKTQTDCQYCGEILGAAYHSCIKARIFHDAGALCMKRCPRCFLPPTVTMADSTSGLRMFLECEPHRLMATGPSLEVAIKNWNTYLDLLVKEAA